MTKHEERIERFKKLRHKTNEDLWETAVNYRESDLFGGAEVDYALDIMEYLDEAYDKIKDTIDEQNHSGASFGMLRNLIRGFHKFSHGVDDIY